MPHPQFPNLTVLAHPLIQHKLAILRDKHTTTRDFKQLVNEIAMLMAYEVTKDLPLEPTEVDTPLERSEEHTSELQSQSNLVCRLLLEKKKGLRNQHKSHDITHTE